jgi:HSP20 family protein
MFSLVPWRRERRGAVAPREADPFTLMRREFDSLFDRFFGRFPLAAEEWTTPNWGLEVVEEEKEIVVRAEAPGFEAGDFDIRVTGETLTIVAERKEAKEGGKEKEAKDGTRTYARLERMVTLPTYADTNKVEATYRNGVLELHFPKMPEAEGKKIEVKA